MSGALALRGARPGSGRARGALREQALVAGGQILAGVGNLAFAFAAVRILDPGSFAAVAVFLAVYLLIHVPARSLEAGAAIEPAAAHGQRRRALQIGALGSIAIAAVGLPLHGSVGLPLALVAALAATPPIATLLALERGRLYGESRHGRVVASLLAEPLVRLVVGIPLLTSIGAAGGGIAVVGGGLAALAVAASFAGAGPDRRGPDPAPDPSRARLGGAAVAAFLLLALIQSEDLLFANSTLLSSEAGRFAALSTLGGIAAFATTTVPFVLMPRARAGERGAFVAALAAAVALGGGAALFVLAAPGTIVELLFGQRYVEIAPLAAPYLAAMALLGVARVLVANDVATGAGRSAISILLAVAAGHVVAMIAIGDSAAGVAEATLLSTGALVVALAGSQVLRLPALRLPRLGAGLARLLGDNGPILIAVVAIVAGALALRLGADRSLWLDEATSWYQSQLPFGEMLVDLRSTDVHPPLFGVLHWLTVRIAGDGELGLRALSIAAGTALVPMLFVTGRALYDRRTGLIAAAFGALSPILIWYSHEARMYALLALFGLIAIWAQHRAIESGRIRYWLLFVPAAAAVVWTHYFGALLIATLQVVLLAVAWRRRREPDGRRLWVALALTTAGILVALAPLVPFALDQFSVNEAAGKGFDDPQQAGNAVDDREVSLYAGLTNAVWAIWGYHSAGTMAALTALWPLLMLGTLLLLGRGASRPTAVLAAAATAPLLPLIALASQQPFLFELRFNMTAVAPAVLLGARALSSWAPSAAWRWGVGGLIGATLLLGTIDQQRNGTNPRLYDFEGALSEVSKRAGPDDVLLYSPRFLNNVIDYYAPEVDAERLRDAQGARAVAEGDGRVRPPRVFVLSSFRDNAAARETVRGALTTLEDGGRELSDRSRYPQVRVWELR